MASLVYPGALHTRFDHSVGAMHVAGKIADAIGLEPEERRLVRLAALLHDVGHGPFSHVSEPILEAFASVPKEKRNKQIHEMLTKQIIMTDKCLGRVLSGIDREHITGILDGVWGDSVMKDIVSGPLDADKQDYLLRDSYFCGVKYGVYDLDRLVGTLCIHQDKQDRYLAIKEDGINTLEQFVLAKYYMTIQVYHHKIRSITRSFTIERALRLGIENDKIDWLKQVYTYDGSDEFIETYRSWTDDRLIYESLSDRTPDGYFKDLFSRLMSRRLHKKIARFRLVEFEDPLVREALASLDSSQILALEKRIGEHLSIDPNLVMIGKLMFKSVREQSRNSESSILVTTATEPRSFEDMSALFRSIDEAISEAVIEIYAPVTYSDEREKKRRQAEYQRDIHNILASIAPQPPKEDIKQ